jgi:hypothetical protein
MRSCHTPPPRARRHLALRARSTCPSSCGGASTRRCWPSATNTAPSAGVCTALAPRSAPPESRVDAAALILRRALRRFANPVDLNGATSWVFLNSPENVQVARARPLLPRGQKSARVCELATCPVVGKWTLTPALAVGVGDKREELHAAVLAGALLAQDVTFGAGTINSNLQRHAFPLCSGPGKLGPGFCNDGSPSHQQVSLCAHNLGNCSRRQCSDGPACVHRTSTSL